MILDENFSKFCSTINGNMAYGEIINIIFILPHINYEERQACKHCTSTYGIAAGDKVPPRYLPLSLHQTGDLYLMAGYFFIMDVLRTLDVDITLNIYISDIDSTAIENNIPVIKKCFKLSLFTHSVEFKDRVASYYADLHHSQIAFPLDQYCELTLISEPLKIDYKSIIHLGDYINNTEKNDFLKACLKARNTMHDFHIDNEFGVHYVADHMRLALKIASPEYHLPYYNGLKPSEAGEFVTNNKNVVLSFIDENNTHQYFYFNKDYINPLKYAEQLYDFISVYMGAVKDIKVNAPILFAVPLRETQTHLTRALIYDHQIIPIGLKWSADNNYVNIPLQPHFENFEPQFHAVNALKMLKNTKETLKKRFPFKYYSIDYFSNDKEVMISSIRTIKTQDLGLITAFISQNKHLIDQYILDHSQFKQHVKEYDITPSIIDTVIVSQLRDTMHRFARNQYFFRA